MSTPLKSIREFCIRCSNGELAEVRNCGGYEMYGQGDENNVCFFYPFRMGRGRPSVRTIRRHCLECMGGSREYVRECEDREHSGQGPAKSHFPRPSRHEAPFLLPLTIFLPGTEPHPKTQGLCSLIRFSMAFKNGFSNDHGPRKSLVRKDFGVN